MYWTWTTLVASCLILECAQATSWPRDSYCAKVTEYLNGECENIKDENGFGFRLDATNQPMPYLHYLGSTFDPARKNAGDNSPVNMCLLARYGNNNNNPNEPSNVYFSNRPTYASYYQTGTIATIRNDGYLLLMRHKDAGDGYFSENVIDTGIENPHDPEANTYSIIGAVDVASILTPAAGTQPHYELELIYKYSDGNSDVLRWTQESWVNATVNATEVVNADLSSIGNDNGYGVGHPAGFHGLAKSSATDRAYLDGSPHDDSWWHAVASIRAHGGGIPGHHQKVAYSSELWVRKPGRWFGDCDDQNSCEACTNHEVLSAGFDWEEYEIGDQCNSSSSTSTTGSSTLNNTAATVLTCYFDTDVCTARHLHHLGDGFCDERKYFNNDRCGYDQGDCCKHTCCSFDDEEGEEDCDYPCGDNEQLSDSDGYDCIDPYGACNATAVGIFGPRLKPSGTNNNTVTYFEYFGTWNTAFSQRAVSSGVAIWRVKIRAEEEIIANANHLVVGIAASATGFFPFAEPNAFGYMLGGHRRAQGVHGEYGEKYGMGDEILVVFDVDKLELRFFKNNVDMGIVFDDSLIPSGKSWHLAVSMYKRSTVELFECPLEYVYPPSPPMTEIEMEIQSLQNALTSYAEYTNGTLDELMECSGCDG